MSVFLHHELVGKKKTKSSFSCHPILQKARSNPQESEPADLLFDEADKISKKVKVHFQNELYFFLANLLRDLADKISKKVKVHFGNEL